mgnify:CR=1 FL=1
MEKPIFIPLRVKSILSRELGYKETLDQLKFRCEWLYREKCYVKASGKYGGDEKQEWRDTCDFIKWFEWCEENGGDSERP